MWLTALALTFHPGEAASHHELLVGGSVTARPLPALGLRVGGDLGVLGPRNRRTERPPVDEVDRVEAEPNVDIALIAELPSDKARATGLVSSDVVLTPLRVDLGERELALDLGLGGGIVRTADYARPPKDSWSAQRPDVRRVEWHVVPVVSSALRVEMTDTLGAQLQARVLQWREVHAAGTTDRHRPVWVSAGLTQRW